MKITDLDTPVLALDLDTLERNIQERAAYCREQGIRVRPHVKTHRCPAIAHLQVEAGVIGITCQKLGEAEVMVQAGIKDILIPYNIVGRVKLERLMRLCRQTRMTVAADSEDTVRGISEAASAEGLNVPVIVEIDTGAGRCGVQTPEAVVVLAEAILDLPGVTFQGIMTHPSQKESGPMLRESVRLLTEAGLPPETVSGGGTGTWEYYHEQGLTELRIGTYAFNSPRRDGDGRITNVDRCSLRIVATVVSIPTAERAIVDAGYKTFAHTGGSPYGNVIDDLDVPVYRMSVEHGFLDIRKASRPYHVGDMLTIIPNGTEVMINQHDEFVGLRGGRVEAIWPIAARGKIR